MSNSRCPSAGGKSPMGSQRTSPVFSLWRINGIGNENVRGVLPFHLIRRNLTFLSTVTSKEKEFSAISYLQHPYLFVEVVYDFIASKLITVHIEPRFFESLFLHVGYFL